MSRYVAEVHLRRRDEQLHQQARCLCRRDAATQSALANLYTSPEFGDWLANARRQPVTISWTAVLKTISAALLIIVLLVTGVFLLGQLGAGVTSINILQCS